MTKKSKEETFVVATIKIRKTIAWTPHKKSIWLTKKDIVWLIDIKKSGFGTSFNEPKKSKVWKRIKKEIYL